MYKQEKGMTISGFFFLWFILILGLDSDDLIPVEGKDEAYDEIIAEIKQLEQQLEKDLKKLQKEVG